MAHDSQNEPSTSDNKNPYVGWGDYMDAKRSKLHTQFRSEAAATTSKLSDIFSGVAIFVNGHTVPVASELKRLMQQHGGRYDNYQATDTTHIVVSNLAQSKLEQWKKRKQMPKVVEPRWITDSIKAGRLLPDVDYSLINRDSRTLENTGFVHQPKPDRRIPPTTDPSFISDFYAKSRLHFISTLAQRMKDYVRSRHAEGGSEFPGRLLLNEVQSHGDPMLAANDTVCVHIDMDCFFVSVARKLRPHLAQKPVVVTHSRGQGPAGSTAEFSSRAEIASCSYEARALGVRNGMYLGPAMRLCSSLVPVPYDFEEYERVSRRLYDIVLEYTDAVCAVSCDELYADIGELCVDYRIAPEEFITHLRARVVEETGCPCSAGMGPNMLVARMATKRAKPAGQFYVKKADAGSFMAGQAVSELPGVGSVLTDKLQLKQVEKCSDLLSFSQADLQRDYGNAMGAKLYRFARGEDDRQVQDVGAACRRSVSCDINYGIRLQELHEARTLLSDLSADLCRRLSQARMSAGSLTLRLLIRAPDAPVVTEKFLGCGHCTASTKTHTFQQQNMTSETVAARHAIQLLEQINPVVADIRGVGLSFHKLVSVDQRSSSRQGGQAKIDALLSAAEKSQKGSQRKKIVNLTTTASTTPSFSAFQLAHAGMPCLINVNDPTEACSVISSWIDTMAAPSKYEVAFVCEYVTKLVDGWYYDSAESVVQHVVKKASDKSGWDQLAAELKELYTNKLRESFT